MSATLSTLSDILKEYYLGPVAEQLNNEVLLLSRLNTRSEDLTGRYAYVPLHVGRSGGLGARGENTPLPAAGSQPYTHARYDLKYLYGRVRVTGPSVAKTKNEAGAFLQALKSELDGMRNDLQKDLARQVYGDGSAKVAQCGTSTSTTTITLATAGSLTGAEAIRKGQLYVGMRIDIGTAADVDTVASNREITGVDLTNNQITISGANVTTSSSNLIYRSGAGVDGADTALTSRSNEVDGLRRIVSTSATAFGNLDPATTPLWDNKRINVNGALATGLEDLQRGLNQLRLEGGVPSAMITTLGVQREIYMELQDHVQYIDPASLKFDAGFKVLQYAGMPIIADIDAPHGNLYMLSEADIKVFSDQDWHFLDMDGQTLRQVADFDAFEAVMTRYMNLGVTRRNTHAVLHGITVDGSADTGV